MKRTAYILSLTIFTLLSSCGSDNDNSNADTLDVLASDVVDPQSIGTISNEIYGSWSSGCIEESGWPEITEWHFGDREVVVDSFVYELDDLSCSNPIQKFHFTYSVSYLPEKQTTVLGDAIKYDIVPIFYSDYTGYNSDIEGIPLDITDQYRIALPLGGKLYGGDPITGDGVTYSNRPTEIDSQSYLIRVE